MADLKIQNLSVDLLQGQANIGMTKHPENPTPERPGFTSININVPIDTPGDKPESQLKKIAIEQAKRSLEEALRVLRSLQP